MYSFTSKNLNLIFCMLNHVLTVFSLSHIQKIFWIQKMQICYDIFVKTGWHFCICPHFYHLYNQLWFYDFYSWNSLDILWNWSIAELFIQYFRTTLIEAMKNINLRSNYNRIYFISIATPDYQFIERAHGVKLSCMIWKNAWEITFISINTKHF